ncbi:hypothetical protein [Micromonospora sp. URMC 103]|uniref:hypothetical protein n=1 Tax=Micromonospora sp. URMC 103 TaxID=3423406 RepID=UPI003F1AF137
MDLAGDRATLAAALSNAPDVTGYQYRPLKPRMGDAWPLLGVMERGPGRSFEATWRVLVWLPQGPQKASEWVDAHTEDIVDALEPVGYVDRIEAVTIPDGDADQTAQYRYALQFTVRSE